MSDSVRLIQQTLAQGGGFDEPTAIAGGFMCAIVPLLFLITGAAYCWKLSGQHDYNRNAARALALMLLVAGSPCVFSLVGNINRFTVGPAAERAGTVAGVIAGLIVLAILLGFIALFLGAIILAMMGLREISRAAETDSPTPRGKGMAIAALVVGPLGVLIVVALTVLVFVIAMSANT